MSSIGSWLLILTHSVFVKLNQYSQILRRQCCLVACRHCTRTAPVNVRQCTSSKVKGCGDMRGVPRDVCSDNCQNKPEAQSSTFQHLQMVEFKPCVSKQARMLSGQLSIEKRCGTCWDNLTRASLSIITKQTRALPLFAVCTLCLCTLCLCTKCLCTLCLCTLCLCTLHSPRIPSCVVASLSNGHAHCIPTNIWQLTNCSYKILTFETWHLVKLHCNPRTLLVKPGPYHIWTWRPQLLTPNLLNSGRNVLFRSIKLHSKFLVLNRKIQQWHLHFIFYNIHIQEVSGVDRK